MRTSPKMLYSWKRIRTITFWKQKKTEARRTMQKPITKVEY
jgi:hypothetical protein